MKNTQLFIDGYIECAVWTEEYEGGTFSLETLTTLRADAFKFFTENLDLLEVTPKSYNYGQAGHDFWLTRNRHGAGFWDRGLGDVGDQLTEKAKECGTCELYIGDDDLVYNI